MPLPKIAAYKITDTTTGVFYIGSTTNLDRRLNEHKNRLTAGKHPNSKVQNGFSNWDNVQIEYIETGDEEQSRKIEQSMLDFHKDDPECANIGTGSTVLWSGGMPDEIKEAIGSVHRGKKVSDESRVRMSIAAQNRPPVNQETRDKLSAAGKGVPKSAEHRDKMRQSALLRGPRNPEDIVNRIAVIFSGTRYDSIRAASNATGLSETQVRTRLSNPSKYPDWSFG